MKDYKPQMSFDEEAAAMYPNARRGDEDATVAFLAELAGDGDALELAIGAGRIALPLSARGVRVVGVDISPAMIAQLRAQPGGESIEVTLGDFADVPVEGNFRLIYMIWNTLFNLLTQDDQVRCFENVAAHLTDDGVFVVEAGRPDFLFRLEENQYVQAESIEVAEVRLDLLRHDPSNQMIEESHVSLSRDGIRLNPVVQRYAWPAEMDLMARIAGLRLKERWGGWDRRPVPASGRNVVSVYGR